MFARILRIPTAILIAFMIASSSKIAHLGAASLGCPGGCEDACNGDFSDRPSSIGGSIPCVSTGCDNDIGDVQILCPGGNPGSYLRINAPCDTLCADTDAEWHSATVGGGDQLWADEGQWITLSFDTRPCCAKGIQVVKWAGMQRLIPGGGLTCSIWRTEKLSFQASVDNCYGLDQVTFEVRDEDFCCDGCEADCPCTLDIDNIRYCVTADDETSLPDDACALPICNNCEFHGPEIIDGPHCP